MKIVFCGTGEIGLPSMKALGDSVCHEVVGVITQPDRPAGRDMRPKPSAIKTEALVRGIPLVQPERIRKDFSALSKWAPDVMIVAAYGQILPKQVLEIPRLGCLNIHASLLPRYRGASPIQAAILSGDRQTGISVMYMDEGLDTGDVLLEEALEIDPCESAGALHDRLAHMAPGALLEALDLLMGGSPPRIPQDPALATYAPKLGKHDGRLDWHEPASALQRRVRAMNPWPGASSRLVANATMVKIHSASVAPGSAPVGTVSSAGSGGIVVGTGEGCLVLRELQLEGRKRLSAGDFLRGFPMPAGTKFDLSFSGSP